MDNHEYTVGDLIGSQSWTVDRIAASLARDIAVRIEDRSAFQEQFRKAIEAD